MPCKFWQISRPIPIFPAGLPCCWAYNTPENFKQPYTALTPTDFWNRWHITLSQWLRDYIFFPLRRGLLRAGGAAASMACDPPAAGCDAGQRVVARGRVDIPVVGCHARHLDRELSTAGDGWGMAAEEFPDESRRLAGSDGLPDCQLDGVPRAIAGLVMGIIHRSSSAGVGVIT